MFGAMFLLALFVWVAILAIKYGRKQDPGPGGWWGRGYKGPREPRPDKPKDPGGKDPDLLYYPDDWDNYLAKWAKKIVTDAKNTIKVGR